MIKYELTKILKNKIVIAFIILFFVLDIFIIINTNLTQINMMRYEQYANFNELYKEIKGKITTKSVNRLYEAEKEFDVYGDIPTMTLAVAKDNYDYRNRASEVVKMARRNYNIYENNKKAKLTNKYIANKFENRSINSYYRTDGIDEYLKYDYSTIMVVMLLVIITSILFVNDRKIGMDKVINTTIYGNNKLALAKINTIICLSIILSIMYRGIESIVFFILYRYDGLLMPMYSVTEYTNSFFGGTILSAFMIDIIMKTIGCIMIGLIISACVLFINNTACAYVISILISTIVKLPVLLFDNYTLFKDNTLYVVGDLVFNRLEIILLISVVLILILYILFYMRFRKRRVKLCGNMN